MMQIRLWFGVMLAMCLWTFGALAQTAGIYAVKDVAANDALNVRSGASVHYEDIGDIAHDGQIRVIGFSNDGKWAEIPWGLKTGWVSTRFLRLVQAEPDAIPVVLQCGGTEPFWSADVSQEVILFQMMGGPETSAAVDWAAPAAGRPVDYIVGFGAGPFTGVLHREICSDGMSDNDYPWSIVLTNRSESGLRVVEGCCSY